MRVYRVADLPPAAKMTGQSAMVQDGGGPVDCTVGGGLFFVICTSDGTTYLSRTIGSPGSGNVNTTGAMVNGNVPISTGGTTLADGGQSYPSGPFADTNSPQVFSSKDLSSSTNIFPSTFPLLGSNNVFTGLNTFRSPAGTSDIIISTGSSGQQAFTRFDDLGTEKWAIGKNNDNTFFLFDAVHNGLTFSTDASGKLVLGVDTSIAPATASGLSDSHVFKVTARSSGGTPISNSFTADSNGEMNWQPGSVAGGAFNFIPVGTNNVNSPSLQYFSYTSGSVLNVAGSFEDTSGNVLSLSGQTTAGFNFYTKSGTPIAALLANGNVAAVGCMQLNGGSGATWCQGSGAPTSTPSLGSLFSRTDTGQFYTYTSGQWSSSQLGCSNILNFGGNNTGSVSNNVAWNNIIAIGGAQACVYFPGGNYLFASSAAWSSGASNSYITVKGDGAGVSNLKFTTGGLSFNGLHTGDAVHVENLGVTTSGVGAATGILLQNFGAQNGFAASSIKNVELRGADGYAASDYWSSAISLLSWSSLDIDNVNIVGSPILSGQSGLGTGVNIGSIGTVSGVIYNIHSLTHSYGAAGVSIGDFVQGVTINQGNFTAVERGVYVLPGSTYGHNDELIISNSQFAAHTAGIDTESPMRHVNVFGNYFIVGASAIGGIFNNYAMTSVYNNQLINVGGSGNGFIFATYSNDASQVVGNQTQFFTTGIWLQAASAHTSAYANIGTSNTNDIVNSGTGNPSSVTFTGSPTGAFQVQDGYVIHQ